MEALFHKRRLLEKKDCVVIQPLVSALLARVLTLTGNPAGPLIAAARACSTRDYGSGGRGGGERGQSWEVSTSARSIISCLSLTDPRNAASGLDFGFVGRGGR